MRRIVLVAATAVAILIGVAAYATDAWRGDRPGGPGERHDAVWSGPLGVTKHEHRLGENVYLLVRGLQQDEAGTVEVLTPEGILYKSFEYDGSTKPDFNQFFFPDTFAGIEICRPEQLVGTWKAVFADGSYPPLEFEMVGEYIGGGEDIVTVVC